MGFENESTETFLKTRFQTSVCSVLVRYWPLFSKFGFLEPLEILSPDHKEKNYLHSLTFFVEELMPIRFFINQNFQGFGISP